MRSTERTAVRERRWAVIAQDGRHAWLGRASDPTEAELTNVASKLAAQGQTAWLAIVEGRYYSKEPLTVLEVRELAGSGEWPTAISNFMAARAGAMSGRS